MCQPQKLACGVNNTSTTLIMQMIVENLNS
jgi:hypothetical protein